MKKLTSSLVAAGMLAASIAPVYASAISVKPLNELSIESETLTEDITIDGKVIPSGTLAVTVNIENNTGFDNSRTMIEIGEAYDVVKGDDDLPVLANGEVLDESLTYSFEANNVMAVVSASARMENTDGAMFTFFVEENESSTNKAISIIDVPEAAAVPLNVNSTNAYRQYLIGDVNNDYYIDASDASLILYAESVRPAIFTHGLPVYVANANLSYYFVPNCICAEAADTYIGEPVNQNLGIINTNDANEIMKYYAQSSVTGGSYSGRVGTLVTEII